MALGQVQQRFGQLRDQDPRAIAFRAQPQPHVERYLLIAAAAGVDLVGHRARALFQLANDEGVDIFVVGAIEEYRAVRLRQNLLERFDDARALVGRQNVDALECPRERLRAANVDFEQPLVEMEGTGEALEDLRRSGLEAPSPELHAPAAGLPAVFFGL